MSRPKGSKNKGKLDPPVFDTAVIADLKGERDWVANIKAFCEKKGFPPSELIARFGGLEAELSYYLQTPKPYDGMMQGTRMPITDDLPAGSEPLADFKPRLKANSGKSAEKWVNATTVEESAKDTPKNKPAELSPFLKSRQADKNNMK